MNVMLTCAGRRNYLVEFFHKALRGQGLVFASDASANAPALQEADKGFVVPSVNRPDYFDVLLDICQENKVKLLISLNDLELPLLARQRKRFLRAGIIPVISNEEVIKVCFDKWATFNFLQNCGLTVPKTYLSLADAQEAINKGEITFPLVIKPRWGTASIGIEFPENMDELECAYKLLSKKLLRTMLADISKADPEKFIIIQEWLNGSEYGLDIINDLQGRYVCTFVKRKLNMRAGETDRAITVEDKVCQCLGRTIGQKLAHVGNLDCDVILTKRGYCILEMNPRFGGGYPFSHVAGADIPAALIAWAKGEEPVKSWLQVRPEVVASKCDRLVLKKE